MSQIGYEKVQRSMFCLASIGEAWWTLSLKLI